MIRVYYLEDLLISINQIQARIIKGQEFIHDAVIDAENGLYKLVQDTTDTEHVGLVMVANSYRAATSDEIKQLSHISKLPTEPMRDLAKEIDTLTAKVAELETKAVK